MFMNQPPPAFPFEFPAISMKVIIASKTAAVKAAKQAQALQTAIAVNACSLPEKSRFASGSKNSKQLVILFAMVCLIINHLSATNPAATLQAQIVITAAITQITQLSNCIFGRTLLNRKQCSLYSNPRQSDNICRIVMQHLIFCTSYPAPFTD